MGLDKKYLPDLATLKLEYKELGHTEFAKTYQRYDAVIGPRESVRFLNQKLTKKTK